MDVCIRKTEINLRTCGVGVIAFGAWAFIKFMLTNTLFGDRIDEGLSAPVSLIVNILVWGFSALILFLRIYVGLSARSESKGNRKTCFYIILTGIMAFFGFASIMIEIALLFFATERLLHLIITMIIDITSLTILIELMVNAIRIRRYRKKVAKT